MFLLKMIWKRHKKSSLYRLLFLKCLAAKKMQRAAILTVKYFYFFLALAAASHLVAKALMSFMRRSRSAPLEVAM